MALPLAGAGIGQAMRTVRDLARAVEAYGSPFDWDGDTYLALTEDIPLREKANFAEGLGVNAADADLRTMHLAGLHFPNGFPGEEAEVAWDEGFGMRAYRVIRSVSTRIAGITIGIDLTVYREPPTIGPPDATETEQRAAWPPPPA